MNYENIYGCDSFKQTLIWQRSVNVSEWLELANCYNSHGELEDAIQIVNFIIENLNLIRSVRPIVYYNRATFLTNNKNYKKAIKDLNKVINLDSNDADAWQKRGFCYDKLGKYNKAITNYNEVIKKLNPNDVYSLLNRGIINGSIKNEHEKALSDFKKVIKLQPNHYHALRNCAIANYQLFRYEEAINYLTPITTKIKPRDSVAWFTLGQCYEKLHRYKLAISYFDRAIELNSKNTKAWLHRGICHNRNGQFEESVKNYCHIISELDPNFVLAWHNLGSNYQGLGNDKKAIYYFTKVISEIDPDFFASWVYCGISYYYLKSLDDCISHINQGLELNNNYLPAYNFVLKNVLLDNNKKEVKLYNNRILYLSNDITTYVDKINDLDVNYKIVELFNFNKQKLSIAFFLTYLNNLIDNGKDKKSLTYTRISYLLFYLLDMPYDTFKIIDIKINIKTSLLSLMDYYYFIQSAIRILEPKEKIQEFISNALKAAKMKSDINENVIEEYFRGLILKLERKPFKELCFKSDLFPYYNDFDWIHDKQNLKILLLKIKNESGFANINDNKTPLKIRYKDKIDFTKYLYYILTCELNGSLITDYIYFDSNDENKYQQENLKLVFSKFLGHLKHNKGENNINIFDDIDDVLLDDFVIHKSHSHRTERYGKIIQEKLNENEDLKIILSVLLAHYNAKTINKKEWSSLSLYAFYVFIAIKKEISNEKENKYFNREDFKELFIENAMTISFGMSWIMSIIISVGITMALNILKHKREKENDKLSYIFSYDNFKKESLIAIKRNPTLRKNLKNLRELT